ncbi:1,2-phenylacetyl-CoA epoxidase subunit PaaD [Subtercola lobariae]|uniref:Phenylacetic acid degradation protein n=1 Tax=Subtercola lobariae TaxID=1588641 RepID=A0A917EVD6_9MICO|nr:1,2-phenylacetyl-CoA epoxidase subunit PaaD [Subtercola lobariae]GGF11779.1 phenylacetic acid degradation protein [Subtercola lobariae]
MVAVADLEREARPRPEGELERSLWNVAATVVDPEVPVLTIEDLGVLRAVRVVGERDASFVNSSTTVAPGVPHVVVDITPTYSGCPAIDAMRDDIVTALASNGYPGATVNVVLSPAWTTDWMSESGRAKLQEYGIAAPAPRGAGVGGAAGGRINLGLGIQCPHCGSMHTRVLSRFGSTSCKALYVCQRCQEPFDYFKDH